MAKSKWPDVKDKLILVEAWARNGLTEEQIAGNLGISLKTLAVYKLEHSDFLHALKKGKEVTDFEVENALNKRARGYRYEEVTKELVMCKDKDEEPLMDKDGNVVYKLMPVKVVVKEVPPDVGAIALWLKNRKPEEWRDRRDVNVTGNLDVKSISDEELAARIALLEDIAGVGEDE